MENALSALRKEAGATPPPPNPKSLFEALRTKDAGEWAKAYDA